MGVLGVVGCGSGDDPGRDPSLGGSGGGGSAGAGTGGTGGIGGGAECFETQAAGRALGGPCQDDTLACNTGLECIPEQPTTIGGADDPIVNYPPGEIDAPLFVDSYCTLPVAATPTGCDPDACAAQCGLCSQGICMNACVPDLDTNSICRPEYQCDLVDLVCFPGCTSDEECRVSRQDDRWLFNTSSEAVCNQETYRCEHAGDPEAEAGVECTFNDDCEPNGVCLVGPGGYCSKFGCDVVGNECAGDGICVFGACLEACNVGSDTITPPETNTQGCREDYTCYWGRADGNSSGFCDVGFFNENITQPNIGAVCETNDECYSPYGYGGCDPDFGCTVFECEVPGLPDVCGTGATCIDFFIDFQVDLFACLTDCTSADDCRSGDACTDLDDAQVCFPFCLSTDECGVGEVCDVNQECVDPTP